jgi:tetratricopeptide (TPR) repeat protein
MGQAKRRGTFETRCAHAVASSAQRSVQAGAHKAIPDQFEDECRGKDTVMSSNTNRTLLVMAQNLRRSGQNDLALPIYRRYVSLEPNHVEALLELGGLLFESKESDEACAICERAINLSPRRVDLRLIFAKHLLQNHKFVQAELVLSDALLQVPAQKSCLIRHTQMLLRKLPERAIKVEQWMVRIGDLVALMICSEYMKQYEGRRIVFELMDATCCFGNRV